MRAASTRGLICTVCVILSPAVAAMTPQFAAPAAPHRPLFEVRFVLLPAAPQSSVLPAVALDDRAAIHRGSLVTTATSMREFGAPAPNVEVCHRRGCDRGAETQRGR